MQQRQRKLRRWFSDGGVLLIGYEMFRNMALGKRLKKARREEFQKLLLDPGTYMYATDSVLSIVGGAYGVQFRKFLGDSLYLYECTLIFFFLFASGADIVVCDEGHVMRNSKSSLSTILSQVKTLGRIVLTGTPLQNNLLECELPPFTPSHPHTVTPSHTCTPLSHLLTDSVDLCT